MARFMMSVMVLYFVKIKIDLLGCLNKFSKM